MSQLTECDHIVAIWTFPIKQSTFYQELECYRYHWNEHATDSKEKRYHRRMHNPDFMANHANGWYPQPEPFYSIDFCINCGRKNDPEFNVGRLNGPK